MLRNRSRLYTVLHSFLGLLVSLSAQLPVACNADEIDNAVLRLKHVKPTKVLIQLKNGVNHVSQGVGRPNRLAPLIPQGISSIQANDDKMALQIQGTPEAVKRLGEIVTLLDIPPAMYKVEAELITAAVDPRTGWSLEVRPLVDRDIEGGEEIVTETDNGPDKKVRVILRILPSRADVARLMGSFQVVEKTAPFVAAKPLSFQIPIGKRQVICGQTTSTHPGLAAFVQMGGIPHPSDERFSGSSPLIAYCLQVRVTRPKKPESNPRPVDHPRP